MIAENTVHVIPLQAIETLKRLDYFLTENVRTARRYIGSLKIGVEIENLQFEILDKRTSADEAFQLLQPVARGRDAGIISEAGCPGIADPGSLAVELAHQLGIKVVPISGPSSIFLALMASGLNGQNFAFHGYLPIDKKDRARRLKELESAALKSQQTQVFMETPYRNERLLDDLLKHCNPDTKLCIAKNITAPDEWIKTRAIGAWRKEKPHLHKSPVIFLIGV